MTDKRTKVEFIESYIKIGNSDYKWNDNHGELIRCRDCKHYDETQRGVPRKEKRRYVCDEFNVDDNFFCADGERRDAT